MGEVIFCETNDGSAGLYNEAVGDIYHSTYGAYSESYAKFLKASGFLDYIKQNDSVKILDICYGIGYNTKTALDEILKLDKPLRVKIDALEYDKELVNISPFLKHQKIDNLINKFIINKSNFDSNMTCLQILAYFYKTRGLLHVNFINLVRLKAKRNCPFAKLFIAIYDMLHNI